MLLNLNPDKKLYLFTTILFVLKCVLLPFVQVVDADAVTRTLITLNWMEAPYFMDTANWAPFHFYYNASFLYFWDNSVLAPVFLNIIFSCLTLFPLYYFIKREFNSAGAFYSILIFSLSPILLRTGFLALAETPFLFLVAMTLNLVSKGIRENNLKWIILAGICITIAGGFRYDAWLLAGLFSIAILIQSHWKNAFVFGLFSIIFPLFWMISNYRATGNPMHSIEANYYYTHQLVGVNDEVAFESFLRRIWFFPFSLIIALGPIAIYIAYKNIFSEFKKGLKSKFVLLLFLIAAVWLVYFYHAMNGNLLLHHRFTGTLILLSVPFVAMYFTNISPKNSRIILVSVVSALLLSYVYNMDGIKPLPRLKDQNTLILSEEINQNIHPKSGLIIDFLNWENSYYIALHSGLRPKQIYFAAGEKNANLNWKQITEFISQNPEGILILKKKSDLYIYFSTYLVSDELDSEIIRNDPEVQILKYKLIKK